MANPESVRGRRRMAPGLPIFLRARVVLPVSHAPIENGVVTISGDRIQAVGRWRETHGGKKSEVVELGDVVLLPGLVNAHGHLDCTDMAGKLPPPRSFADWIKAVVELKAHWEEADYVTSWRRGAQMLLQSGTTTVANVESRPTLIPRMWQETPLRVISFREVIGLRDEPSPGEKVGGIIREWSSFPGADGRVGLSPHAPYSTTPELLRQASRLARKAGWWLTTHVAESEEEFQMFMYRHGPLYDWLKTQRDMSDCGLGSPVRHLERCGYLGKNLVAVHANYLERDDALALSKSHASVVHCPRSHAYFRHMRFPRDELRQAGVNLCLGTDSLASVRGSGRANGERGAANSERRTGSGERGGGLELSLFEEMKTMAAAVPDLAPLTVLKMATVNSARALGLHRQVGELAPNALADLIVLPFAGKPAQAYEAVVHHTGGVAASMIDGRWAIPPRA